MRHPLRAAAAICLVVVLAGCYGDTESAEDVTDTSATLMAWGVPQTRSTDYYFEYGTTESFGQRTILRQPNDLTIGATYPMPEPITGLIPNTRYYFRMCGKERNESQYVCGHTRSFLTAMFTNPPKVGSGPYYQADVKIIRADGRYWGSGTGCTLRDSSDAITWDHAVNVCGTSPGMYPPNGKLNPNPGDTNVNFWGTEVAQIGGRWILTTSFNRPWALSGRPAGYSRGAIYIATATSPAGPYTWQSDAVVKDQDAVIIDPSLFSDPKTGKLWLTYSWRKTYPTGTRHNELRVTELNTSTLAAVGQPMLLMSTAIEPQDRELAFPPDRIIEGPGIFYHSNRYYFYYAAGTVEYDYQKWNGRPYTLNVASSTTFPKRFTKPAQPTLSGGNGWRLPGHGAFFQDADGTWWTAMSPYRDGEPVCEPEKTTYCGLARTVFLQKASYYQGTQAFTVYDGVLKPGPIGRPLP